ncbi:MAG: MFS family permease [Maritalea sp.]|jgi:MFS family permease
MVGVVTAAYFFSIAFGASLSTHVSRLFKRRHIITLSVTVACLAAIQIALALQGTIIGFVAIFILYSVILGASETPASSILHSCVEDRQRSTMLSLRSLIQQLGAAVGLILVGAVAEAYTTPVAWMVAAVFLVIALLLMGLLVRRIQVES